MYVAISVVAFDATASWNVCMVSAPFMSGGGQVDVRAAVSCD